jgi:hypothetical protein
VADLPRAEVAHRAGQRLRLRFPRHRGDADFFAKLERTALFVEGVLAATGRPATGSLIIRHKSDYDTLAAGLREEGVCDVSPEPEDHRPEIEARHLSQELNTRLYEASGGQLDLRALAAFGLVMMGVVQLARGQVFAPATTALWYGLTLLLANGRGAPGSDGNGD